jgi:hypothetical protein
VANQQDIERRIVKEIISEVHDGSMRLSDSSQRELRLIIRKRISGTAKSREIEVNKEELDALIAKFAEQLHEKAPSQSGSGRKTIVRKSFMSKIIDLFSDIWPFGG